jgi:succinate-semialdehyde dehydrogenase / glutarate-semialdehyde dehydrogenase
MVFTSVDPTTGEPWQRYDADSPGIVDRKLALAAERFESFRRTTARERSELLARVAALLDAERAPLAQLITREMGKPIVAARGEVEKCATTCRFYAENAQRLLLPELVDGNDQFVCFEPLGVILGVMPWNFPFWQVIRFAAPALAAGNVGILKHASNVPSCALALEAVFRRAGAEEGVFSTLLVDSDVVSSMIADRRIAAVTLTGSEGAGKAVGTAAGAQLKKSVLELGGSDAFVVLSSADLTRAIAAAVRARTVNSGQSCIAAKRFIVVDELYAQFTRGFVAAMQALRVGDPNEDATDIGPLATPSIREAVDRQVREILAGGGKLLLGGSPTNRAGNFYPATVLGDVSPSLPAAREEIFGPVALVLRAKDAAHALELANDSEFGLGASVWTTDRAEADWFSRELQVGCVFVNAMVSSDARFPFGGVKRSGYGRELGAYGLREFVNVKTVRRFFGEP